jgi:hypothetical protein
VPAEPLIDHPVVLDSKPPFDKSSVAKDGTEKNNAVLVKAIFCLNWVNFILFNFFPYFGYLTEL